MYFILILCLKIVYCECDKEGVDMLSQTLKKLRENCGYTQQQVADALNIDRSTYAYYETGKTTPDINTIIKLSKIFNVPYTEIFENEEDSNVSRVRDVATQGDEFLQKYGRKNNERIYDLTKNEQQMIIGFRLLPSDEQEEIMNEIYIRTRKKGRK